MTIIGKKGEAVLEKIESKQKDGSIKTSHFMQRGKLNIGDKHFGMRSNLKYRKELSKNKIKKRD